MSPTNDIKTPIEMWEIWRERRKHTEPTHYTIHIKIEGILKWCYLIWLTWQAIPFLWTVLKVLAGKDVAL